MVDLFNIQPTKTYVKEHILIEEDEIAQIQEIFKSFDTSNRGRIPIDHLPTILRLLNKNISENDVLELQYEIDKKHRGYFTLNDLIQLLSDFQFIEDTEQDLMAALQELDQGADGFIPKESFALFLTSMGEVFNQDELNEFMKYALEDNNTDDLIDIRRLCKIMLPKIQARKELLKENLNNNGGNADKNLETTNCAEQQKGLIAFGLVIAYRPYQSIQRYINLNSQLKALSNQLNDELRRKTDLLEQLKSEKLVLTNIRIREEVFNDSNKKIDEKKRTLLFQQKRYSDQGYQSLLESTFLQESFDQHQAATTRLADVKANASQFNGDIIQMKNKQQYIIIAKLSRQQQIRNKDFHQDGMASEVYNTELMLKRKELLISKIQEVYKERELVEFDKEMLYNMFLTIREQRTHDIAKVNEIKPYFEFQNKIHLVLDRIKQTSDVRMKIIDHRIKQCKVQAKENKKELTLSLKEKVGELIEEEIENRTHKLNMVVHSRQATNKETKQVKLENHSNMQRRSSIMIAEPPQQKPKTLVVSHENYQELKILSDQLDLVNIFQKFLNFKYNKETVSHNLPVLTHSYNDQIEALKEALISRMAKLEAFKKEESLFAQIQLAQMMSSKSLSKKRSQTIKNQQDSFSRTIQHQPLLASESSTNSRNQNLSNSSSKLKKSSLQIVLTEQEVQEKCESLHQRMVEQTITQADQFELDESIIISMNELQQTRTALLLKDHSELNQQRLDKQNQFQNLQQLKNDYFINHPNEIIDNDFFDQISLDSNQNTLANPSAKESDIKIRDLWHMYQRNQEFMIFNRDLMRIKSHLERIKWCLNEQTNMYAYKICLMRDLSEVKMDKNVEKIIKKYKQIWPYQPMDYYNQDKRNHLQKIQLILKRRQGVNANSEDGKYYELVKQGTSTSRHQHRRTPTTLEDDQSSMLSTRKLKSLIHQDGLIESPIGKLKQSVSAIEKLKKSFKKQLENKIEVPLLFSNIKDFLKFLVRQVDPQASLNSNMNTEKNDKVSGNTNNFGAFLLAIKQVKEESSNNDKPEQPLALEIGDFDQFQMRRANDLSDVYQNQFKDKYMKFLLHNDQNLTQLLRKQREDQEESQSGIQKTQEQALEDRHMGETHSQFKLEMLRRLRFKQKISAKQKNWILYNTKQGLRSNSVTNQVNNDKCMYSKLLTFERQESAFVTKFLKQFEQAKSKLNHNDLSILIDQTQNQEQKYQNINPISQKQTVISIKTENSMKPPLQQKNNMTKNSKGQTYGTNLQTSLKSSINNSSVAMHKIYQQPLSQQSQTQQQKLKVVLRAQSAQKPPRLSLNNLSIEQINTKETLSQIKSLIKRSATHSTNRSTQHQQHSFQTLSQVVTPKARNTYNLDLKGLIMNNSSSISTAADRGRKSIVLNQSLATNNLISNVTLQMKKIDMMNRSATQFNKISKL